MMNRSISDSKILIVDDTEANIEILIEALGEQYDLSVAIDGCSALDSLKYEKPDLVLLDIMMQGMSGYEVCEKIKQNSDTKDIPVIFLSAITDVEGKTKGFDVGGVDYITKPFEIREVQARVKTHLALIHANRKLVHQNEHLETEVERRTKELMLTQEATIDAIASLVEYRDEETGGHIQRTKKYVRLIANCLKDRQKYRDVLDEATVDLYYRSAPLHDIGKICIRDEVLLKPGVLTEEEFEEIKRHTIVGGEMLSIPIQRLGENSFLRYAQEFARYHHERWDGSGYPEGLSGVAIPLSGRIMAIADVYDALISKRVYKNDFSHSEAVNLIKSQSGKHFDPDLVEVFLENEQEFWKIADDNR